MQHKLIIIGTGPSGLTAGIYASRAELSPLILTGTTPGGQLMGTSDIENFPGFPDGIFGAKLMQNMQAQAEKFGAKIETKTVSKVDFSDPNNLKIYIGKEEYQTKTVIIATGASARWLNLNKGEEKYLGKGYTACATCDGAFYRNKQIAVVGGGDTALEEALFLTKFASKVFLLHRRDQLRASKSMQNKIFKNEKIEVLWNKAVTNLYGDSLLDSVELTDTNDQSISELSINGLFMAIGHIPNTSIFKDFIDMDEFGYLKVKNHTNTKIESVFVAGDVADNRYRQAITAAGGGCMAALDAEKYLAKLE